MSGIYAVCKPLSLEILKRKGRFIWFDLENKKIPVAIICIFEFFIPKSIVFSGVYKTRSLYVPFFPRSSQLDELF
ncbi:unnamed protein product [Meloidogyne enterolobii]|uniref:Uncharacterized protein n=1 Tax=Meloidogyne enterolobii TaxID=390850 RepID=A0ACB0XMB8_MELEN